MDVREVFEYEPDTGRLRRRALTHGNQKVYPGAVGSVGYLHIYHQGRMWYAHRLIWEWHHGPIPEGMQIDHIDCDRLNNRIENLRLATNTQNAYNARAQKRGESGFKGVFRHHDCRRRPFQAHIRVGGRRVSLGYYATAEEAHAAYATAAKKYAGEFARAA